MTHEANPAAGAPGYGGMLIQYVYGRSSAWKITPSRYVTTHSYRNDVSDDGTGITGPRPEAPDLMGSPLAGLSHKPT